MEFVYFTSMTVYVESFGRIALNQSLRIKQEFMRSILKQNMAWFESSTSSGSMATSLISDLQKIEYGIGEPIGNIVNQSRKIVAQFIVCFFYERQLALILLALTPLFLGAIGLIQWSTTKYSSIEGAIKANLGYICNEIFSMIKTVMQFSGEKLK